jgi:5'-deoxynucleotidase YfbR-like HD superfamily hydrolase
MNITKRQLKRIIKEMVDSHIQQPMYDEDLAEIYENVTNNALRNKKRVKTSTAADIFVEGRIKITKRQLRKIIREQILREEKEERIVFDPDDVDLPIPAKLKKLLNPDLSPQKFAAFDAELDASGTPQHQGFAIAAYTMTYADNDLQTAKKILQTATGLIPKIAKAMEGGESTEEKGGEGEKETKKGGGGGLNQASLEKLSDE